MKSCTHTSEVARVVRAGQWPQACSPDLRAHIETCSTCAEEAHILAAFACARESAIASASPQSPGLLWWKAQLRRRREAMHRLERPGVTLPVAAIGASILLLAFLFAGVASQLQWSRLRTVFASTTWTAWTVSAIATLLCGLAIVALVVAVAPMRQQD